MIAKSRKLGRLLIVPVWRRVLLNYHVAAGVEHRSILRGLDNIQTIVDVGANRGQFALVARHCFPQARIISFEPLDGPAAIFRQVFFQDKHVRLHAAAISEHADSATIHVSARDDSSSLLPITGNQSRLFPGTAERETQTIRTERLKHYVAAADITPPALLKLDVQGYELRALHGCEDLLDRFAYVYAECSFIELYAGQALADEVIAWLREHGFRLSGVYNMSYDRSGRAVQGDFLFGRNRI